MENEPISLDEALSYALTILRGVHAEVRAMRLEQRAMLNKLSDADTEMLRLSLCVADEVAEVLDGPDEPMPDARMLS